MIAAVGAHPISTTPLLCSDKFKMQKNYLTKRMTKFLKIKSLNIIQHYPFPTSVGIKACCGNGMGTCQFGSTPELTQGIWLDPGNVCCCSVVCKTREGT